MRIIFLLALGLCVLIAAVQVSAEELGLRLSVYLNDTIYSGINYTKLFKIENLDHKSGITDHINVSVGYNISDHAGALVFEGTFEVIDLNSWRIANTGNFLPQNVGIYTLCGWIINSSANDSNKDDDFACKEVIALDETVSNVTQNNITNTNDTNGSTTVDNCDIMLSIRTERDGFNENEVVYIYHQLSNNSIPFIIDYWIEDFLGNVVKERCTTENTNKKQWTAKGNGTFIIKSNLSYIECNDSNTTNNYAEKIITVIGNVSSTVNNPDANSSNNVSKKKNKLKYSIISMPSYVISGKEFEIVVEIENEGDEHSIEIWSYVYRGSKCYSCYYGERDENKQTFIVYDGDSIAVWLKNIVYAEPGSYKLKVKVRKDDLKAPYELTEDIVVDGALDETINEPGNENKTEIKIRDIKDDAEKDTKENKSENKANDNSGEDNLTNYSKKNYELANNLLKVPKQVYESSDAKAQGIVPFLIIGIVAVFVILILLKR